MSLYRLCYLLLLAKNHTLRLKADLHAFERPLDVILDGWWPGPEHSSSSASAYGASLSDASTSAGSAQVVGEEHKYEVPEQFIVKHC